MAIFDTFNTTTTFSIIPIGDEFIEALTTCNEIATRIEPTTHKGRAANAMRADGKYIWMADWEPGFIRAREV